MTGLIVAILSFIQLLLKHHKSSHNIMNGSSPITIDFDVGAVTAYFMFILNYNSIQDVVRLNQRAKLFSLTKVQKMNTKVGLHHH